MTKSILPFLRIAEALREHDLSLLAEKERALEIQKRARRELKEKVTKSDPELWLDWPGASERWQAFVQVKLARLEVHIIEAEAEADQAREDARKSFGRALVLNKVFSGNGNLR